MADIEDTWEVLVEEINSSLEKLRQVIIHNKSHSKINLLRKGNLFKSKF